MPKLPDVIGRFKIVDQIAQGGMGALYLAWDPTLERRIAIKLLRDDSDELRERFSREARFVARLRHPRIVTIFDVGEHDGQPFIAMEYVQGNTLADIVRAETALPLRQKLKWVEELCDGLGFAHRAGIVHRDVKPANLIVDADGSIKILDFGIARDGPGRTQAGMLIGSLNYMSPEQVLGRPVDQRSDVFAVGGVLYELLTYRQAFSGGLDSGILAKILHDAPEAILSIQPDLNRDIAQIVERALEKDPANRYQDIQGMQRDLLRVLRQLDGSETKIDPDRTAVIFPQIPRPIPPARTTRREPDRAALERRRGEQIQAHLEAARAAMSAGDCESAIASCEQALLLDSVHPIANELLEQASAALDARRADELLDAAQREFAAGALTSAFALVQQAVDLGQMSPKAFLLKDAIEDARAERERERQRLEAGQQAVERAGRLFEAGSFDEAVSAADEALTLLPDDAHALSVKQRASSAADAERLERLNERARITSAEARRLFAGGQHAEALNLLEEFDPRSHENVVRTFDELKTMLGAIERQVQECLAEASAAVSAGDLDRAAAYVRDALALAPAHKRARTMDAAIREQARQRELAERVERERQQAVSARLAKAAQTASHDEALVLINEALELDPHNEDARRSFEIRSAALVDERARITTSEARRLFAAGEHAEALHLLEGFDPRNHEDVVRTFDELETMLQAIEQQVQEYLAEASAALAAHELEKAATRVREALALEPTHERARAIDEQISDALRERARQRELEERLERERQQAVAGRLARAVQTTDHEKAVALINEALELDPQNEEARRSFEIRSAALEEERAAERRRNEIASAYQRIEEMLAGDDLDAAAESLKVAEDGTDARKALEPLRRRLASRRLDIARRELAAVRQREREQAVAEALDRANRAVSHEVAVATYRQILDLEPGHQLAQQGLSTRQAAVKKERLAAAALDRAAAAVSDSEAVTALREVLELQPDLPDVLLQLQEHEVALARQQEDARQKLHDDATAGRIARIAAISSHAAALVELRKILELYPENAEARRLCDLRELALKAEQEATDQHHEIGAVNEGAPQAYLEDQPIPGEDRQPDEDPYNAASSPASGEGWLSFGDAMGRRTCIVGAIAAAILLIVVAYVLNARESAPPDVAVPASEAAEADLGGPKPAPPPLVAPDPAPPNSPGVKDPPPQPVDPLVELENRLAPIRALARRQVEQGNQRQAVDTIASGLKLQPDDAALRRMLADMVQDAIATANVARDSAVSAGFGVENFPRYRDGRMKEREGLRLAPRRPEAALNALWDAASLYSQATEEARKAKQQEPPLTVPTPPAPAPAPPKKAETAPLVEHPSAPVIQPRPPAASPAADEAAIRAVLRGYEHGFAALNVQEIQRVYPDVNAVALGDNFKRMRALSVEIIDPQISIVGSTATVVCQVRQRYTPYVGNRGQSTVNSVFRLGKRGDAWVIVERR